ncbi:MAG: acylneuraminate cytidylyltransferase [Chloroflexi bacterium]|nr:acylneuraminate cytidylyltransferase [Chloroflexota bacterium]
MVKQAQVLALIPARGGSKGIPRKNIRDFAGAPLIVYSIAAALQSETVTRVIVSTDDQEIAAVARAWGAEAPFLRPAELAQDLTQDLPVFEHVLNWLAREEGSRPDVVVQLRPTSPIRPVGCVDAAVRLLLGHPEADSVRGVVPAGQNPHKMWRVDPQTGRMTPLLMVEGFAEPYNAPRQQLPAVFWQTGHIDAIRPQVILDKHSMSGETILSLMIDPRYTVDLDNLRDWERAEWLSQQPDLNMVFPDHRKRKLPDKVSLVVYDFDGVMTDNRVWVNLDGSEVIAADRSDGWGIARLRDRGIAQVVITGEINPVVKARCDKLRIPVVQGARDKPAVLRAYMEEYHIDPAQAVYLGNDVNDVPCFPLVACAVVVADAYPEAIEQADIVLQRKGGMGAVRELCDRILSGLDK